jgi:hypothetical protein
VLFDVFNDQTRDVDAGRLFDPFEPRGRVYFDHEGSTRRTQDIDTGHVESDDSGGAHRHGPLLRCDLHGHRHAAAVQIRPKLPGGTLALHGRHHFAANDEATHIRASGFPDKTLDEKLRGEPAKSIDDAVRRLACLRQHHAAPLGSRDELDHDGHAPDERQQILGIVGRAGKAGHGQADTVAR